MTHVILSAPAIRAGRPQADVWPPRLKEIRVFWQSTENMASYRGNVHVCLCLSVCHTEWMFNCVYMQLLVSVCVSLSVCMRACSGPVRRMGRGRQIFAMADPAVPQIWCEEQSEGVKKNPCHLSFKWLMLPRNENEWEDKWTSARTHTRLNIKWNAAIGIRPIPEGSNR